MTRIDDMNETERRSWMTLLADIGVLILFLGWMTEGGHVIEHSPSALMRVFIALIVATIIIHSIIAIIFAGRTYKEAGLKDERDWDIERRGDQAGFWVLAIAVNIVIFLILAAYVFPTDYHPIMGLETPSALFFALMGAMFVADIAKRAMMIWAYRR